MQMIDITSVKVAKATDRRALAILAYDNATADPDGANWRAVADMLRLAMPVSKAKAAAQDPASPFAPWADYAIPQNASGKRLGKSPVIVVMFSDGETVRAPAVSLPGKPVNIGRGVRVAIAYYLGRAARKAGKSVTDIEFTARVEVAAITSCVCETSGATYDPAQCNATAAAAKPVLPPEAERDEYTSRDLGDLAFWASTRPHIAETIEKSTGELWVTEDRAARLAFAVMAFWPDARDVELSPPVAPSCEPGSVAPAKFKAPAHLLRTSRLVPVKIGGPVAPSCVIRLAA